MTSVSVVKTHWLGTTGGPGLSQIAFRKGDNSDITATDAQTCVNAVRTFWNAITSYIPNEVTLTVDPIVDSFTVLSQNNDLHSSVSAATAPAVVTGIATGSYSMAAGLRLEMNTGVIRFGRRVRGSLFIVPTDSSAFSNVGTTNPSAKSAIEAAADTMRVAFINNATPIVVWSRWNKIKHPERPSAISDVNTIKLNDKTAILRGRRD